MTPPAQNLQIFKLRAKPVRSVNLMVRLQPFP